MWVFELLFGMAIGYYIMSKTFRATINGILGRKKKTVEHTVIIPEETCQEENTSDLLSETEPSGNGVSVSETEIAKWFRENPELRKLNEMG